MTIFEGGAVSELRFAEVGGTLWACVLTERGWRCGRCLRGVFQGLTLASGLCCKVCGAEHWIGKEMVIAKARATPPGGDAGPRQAVTGGPASTRKAQ